MKQWMALVTALAAAACSDQLPGGTRYELVRASNNPLPLLLREDECRHFLHGGEVVFDGKGGFTSRYDIRKTCGDSTADVVDPGTAGKFRIRNDTAFFVDASGKPTGFGLITSDSLIVTGMIHRLVYVRDRN